MIKEVWEFEIQPGGGGKRWAEVADWLTRMAQATKKHKLVIDACGLRNENGDAKTLHTAHLVIDFDTMENRNAFYQDDSSAAFELMNENNEKQYVTERMGHYYYTVYQ